MGDVRVEQRGRVLVATLENPPHGLMDTGIVAGLTALVERADVDQGVGAVVLTGAHPERFVAHYDVGELLVAARNGPSVGRRAAKASLRVVGALRRVRGIERALERTPAAGVVALERFHEILLAMNRSGAVFVAALNGSAMGGGCELALACDVRVMAEGDFGMGQPEILFGFPPGGGGTQRLARMLGSARALRLVLDGGPVSPAEALRIGLIDELVPAENLLEHSISVAGRLGARAKAGVAACKRAVYEGGSLPLSLGLREEQSVFMATLGTADAEDAMSAYQDALQRTHELPGYDRETLEQALRNGRFGTN
jgi:enoyl-CoA hydratase/carnithine racemase